jgi:hypothetical protein
MFFNFFSIWSYTRIVCWPAASNVYPRYVWEWSSVGHPLERKETGGRQEMGSLFVWQDRIQLPGPEAIGYIYGAGDIWTNQNAGFAKNCPNRDPSPATISIREQPIVSNKLKTIYVPLWIWHGQHCSMGIESELHTVQPLCCILYSSWVLIMGKQRTPCDEG